MTVRPDPTRLHDSAARLGLELSETDMHGWIEALAKPATETSDIVTDHVGGFFGHRSAMVDYSPADIERFRSIGAIVEIPDVEGVVETALALSGSAAQSRFQTYPGDCDYFERINIIAASREEACEVLAGAMREKGLSALSGEGYQLMEIKFGSFPHDVMQDGALIRKGSPISWNPAALEAGEMVVERPGRGQMTITWDGVRDEPGWCKLDWVVADPLRGELTNASNMLDVTWEAPDGAITPLDGYLDGYFQEIYLDAESAPIFTKLVKHVNATALDDYIVALRGEVLKYWGGDHAHYGKAAKRLYNIFRLSGHYDEATFLRQLFDEPAALLYQAHALVQTVQHASTAEEAFETGEILDRVEELIISVVKVLEGSEETDVLRLLLKLYRALATQDESEPMSDYVQSIQAELMNMVNNFFHEQMQSVPTIPHYVDEIERPA